MDLHQVAAGDGVRARVHRHPLHDVDDVRWQFGVPPKGNANFVWVQHFIHHLSSQGMAGLVLANGSMSSNQSGEREILATLYDTLLPKLLSEELSVTELRR